MAHGGKGVLRTAVLALLVAAPSPVLLPSPALGLGDGDEVDVGDPKKPKTGANDPRAPLETRVNQAIEAGVKWLRKQVFVPGNWANEVKGERFYDDSDFGKPFMHPSGCTSLSLYTLLKCGVPATDPVIVNGFKWLRGHAAGEAPRRHRSSTKAPGAIPRGSYEISVLVLALEARGNPFKREKDRVKDLRLRIRKGEKLNLGVKLPPEDAQWMRDLVDELARKRAGKPGWRYDLDNGSGIQKNPNGDTDMSSTQLAMLAFLAAERCGISQPDSFYLGMLDWILRQQQKEPDGKVKRWQPPVAVGETTPQAVMDEARGWGYMMESRVGKDTNPTSSMTACALANLAICANILEIRENKDFDARYADRSEKAWNEGIAWHQITWDIKRNTGGSYHYYYLYCIERLGDLKRLNIIAGHPWYEEGAKVLVDEQDATGAWLKRDCHEPQDILNTCFALLFLNKSTTAISAGH